MIKSRTQSEPSVVVVDVVLVVVVAAVAGPGIGQGLLAGTRFVLLGGLCLQGAPNVDSRDHGK